MDEFMKCLEDEKEDIVEILSHVVPMNLSDIEEQSFQSESDCHICEKLLGADRVRDHDHLTGKYRGAAHNDCNLNYKFAKENIRKPGSFQFLLFYTTFEAMIHI